jgi:hypothetical protein
MAYSRKGRLIFRSASFAVVATWGAFVFLFHPSRSAVPYVASAVIIVCFALAIRAFLYLDEIQRAQRMRACFYGVMLGVWVATFVVLFMMLNPPALDMLADILHRHQPHLPLEYFVVGVMTPLITQTICSLAVSVAMRLKPGA